MFYTEFATFSNQAFVGASASDLLLYADSNTKKLYLNISYKKNNQI